MPALARIAVIAFCALAATASASDKPKDIGHLWKVSRPGVPDSFVLGTIHIPDPRVSVLSAPVRDALSRSQTLAVELIPEAFDPRTAEFELLDDGARLSTLLGRELFDLLQTALVANGMQPARIDRLKPWAAMMKLRRNDARNPDEPSLDTRLYLAARAQRIKVLPLEMIEEQISAFDSIPLPSQIALLEHALRHRDALAATVEPTILAWQRGHFRALEAVVGEAFDPYPGMGRHRAQLIRHIIEGRTVLMHHRLAAPLRSGRVFVAIGAMHLAGPRGLLEMLRADGYRLSVIW